MAKPLWQPGMSGNPRGRPKGRMPSKIVLWDLKMEMRRLCPSAAKVVERCLKSEDDKIALAAAEIAFERGFGRPELHADGRPRRGRGSRDCHAETEAGGCRGTHPRD